MNMCCAQAQGCTQLQGPMEMPLKSAESFPLTHTVSAWRSPSPPRWMPRLFIPPRHELQLSLQKASQVLPPHCFTPHLLGNHEL